jgi:hypothetical protein
VRGVAWRSKTAKSPARAGLFARPRVAGAELIMSYAMRKKTRLQVALVR